MGRCVTKVVQQGWARLQLMQQEQVGEVEVGGAPSDSPSQSRELDAGVVGPAAGFVIAPSLAAPE